MNDELREAGTRSTTPPRRPERQRLLRLRPTTGVISLGSGDPLAAADLRAGERVLDLGSGAGPDVIRAAEQVGPAGIVWGLDMTDEMLALARENAAEAGATNAHFLQGHIEEVPLPAESVDVAISNCVINLSTDKPAVFRELARVARSRRPRRDQRHRRRGPADARRASRARLLLRLHRGRALEKRVRGRARRRRLRGRLRRVHLRGRRGHARRDRQGEEAGLGALAPDELVGESADRSADRRRDEIDPE